jgi:hypothetical protein
VKLKAICGALNVNVMRGKVKAVVTARIKLGGGTELLALPDGLLEALGLTLADGDSEGLTLAEGEMLELIEALGLAEALGEIDKL